ncbi:MAG: hypothetical protein LBI17_03505 [Rickettsiales bacterium]|jgi:hypothetical protein|nr:hypothetical protein [Rickettsiales bacterium]
MNAPTLLLPLLPEPAHRKKPRGNPNTLLTPDVIELNYSRLYRPKIRRCVEIAKSEVYKLSTIVVRDKMPDVSVNLWTGKSTRFRFDKISLLTVIFLAGLIKTEKKHKLLHVLFDDMAIDQYGRRAAKIAIIYQKCVENGKIRK